MVMTDIDVLRNALAWLKTGQKIILATVIQTWGSAPRKAGSHMVIREDGVFAGSISGGCVEGAVIQEALQELDGVGREISFGISTEEAWEVGLSCGGELRVWLEAADQSILNTILCNIDQRIVCALYFSLDGSQKMQALGNIDLGREENTAKSILDSRGNALRIYYPPRRVFVIGAVHIAQAFSLMAGQVGYEVIIIDPREIFVDSQRWGDGRLRRIALYPDECLPEERLDSHDALIALSHDPKIDDIALKIGLEAGVFYIGALGSKKNHAKRCRRLMTEYDCSEAAVSRISGPIGLDIGAKTPAEIAVSILAELISYQGNR